MIKIFENRREAGKLLAGKLSRFKNHKQTLILALPRGGVPVGYEIAQALNLPLDIFLVRKLGVPGQEELAFGAIAMGDTLIFNEELVAQLGLSAESINAIIASEQQVLNERNQKYRGARPFPNLTDQCVILVDDGIATGATMRAAITAIRALGCAQLIVAVPVAPPEIFDQFAGLADQIICLETPAPFFAIGGWYQDFSQTTDAEVHELLTLKKLA